MVPKKKTATEKAAKVVKKTTKAKKVTKKAVSLEKKPAMKVVKARTVKASAKIKKVKNSKTSATSIKKAFSYMDWENVLKGSFKAFPKIWWRVVIVNVTTLLLILLSIITSVGVFVVSVGGVKAVESVIANLQLGGIVDLSVWSALFFALFILINLMIIIGTLGKISNFLVIKGYISNKNKNPLSIYFKDSWAYFWKYLWLGLLIMWYILWPLLVMGLLILIVGLLGQSSEVPPIFAILFSVATGIGITIFTVYRCINVLFYQSALIHFDGSASESFKTSLAITKGNWWSVFFGIFVFFLMIWVAQMIVNIPGALSDFGIVPEVFGIGSSLLAFIFSFFILGPISVSFLYFMMLQIARNKKITL